MTRARRKDAGIPRGPRESPRAHTATWCPHRKDYYEQALCNTVMNDARYEAIRINEWYAGLKLWMAGKIVACQLMRGGLALEWVEYRKAYRREHRRPKGDATE